MLRPAEMRDDPENFWEFLNMTLRSMYDSHQLSNLDHNVADREWTVRISGCGISAVQFDIQPGSEEYQRLYDGGKQAVECFQKTNNRFYKTGNLEKFYIKPIFKNRLFEESV